MNIGEFDLQKTVLVVAEIGNNHEGDYALSEKLVREAKECGVDAVKLQTFRTALFANPKDRVRYERLRSFELSCEQFAELSRLAKSLGLLFISTPLDLESAHCLRNLVDGYKIASGDNNFYPLIEVACSTGKPLIISTGLSDLAQIQQAKQFVEQKWREFGIEGGQMAFLHCVTSYPVPDEQANLAAIPLLARKFECTVGYSDHTLGADACLAAVALGARIIEKHFTLDKQYSDFRDHRISADPDEMRRMVQGIRRITAMLGKGEKILQPCEADLASAARRSIVAATDLPSGHRVMREDLLWLRPASGLPPGNEDRIIGKVVRRPIPFGEPILLTDVEER